MTCRNQSRSAEEDGSSPCRTAWCKSPEKPAMPQILTTNAIITCPHGGKGTTIPTVPKWRINGGFVSVEGDTGSLACPFLIYPCIGYTLQSMGLNATTMDQRK